MMKVAMNKKLYIVAGLLAMLIVGSVFFLYSKKERETSVIADELSLMKVKGETEEPKKDIKQTVMKVDVKGAVNRPGVYVAKEGERVLDVINKAGSFTAQADKNSVNLAQRVQDQMLIYVPVVGENPSNVISPAGQATGGASASSSNQETVNLNTATETELQTLTGIGPAKAAAIIQFRTEQGSFKSVEDLKNVSGIGDKTFEKIQDQVSI